MKHMYHTLKSLNTRTIATIVAGLGVFAGAIVMACSAGGGGGGGGAAGFNPADCLSGKISTMGEAPIYTSIETSRRRAKRNACLKAIQKCIGEQVSRQSGVSDGQSIANEIFSEAKGICRNDRVQSENRYKLDTVNMLRMQVAFTVNLVDVQSAIDTAQKLAGNPKVLVLIREEYNLPNSGKRVKGFTSPDSVSSARLREFLISKGYEVIPPEKARPTRSEERAWAADPDSQSAQDKLKGLKDRAAKAGADVLIIGKIEMNQQDISTTGPFKSMQATGVVRLLTLWGRGKELGVYKGTQGGAHTRFLSAAQAAAHRFAVGGKRRWKKDPRALARFVQRKLKSEWARVTKANQIIVRINGMSAKHAGLFRDELKEKTAVKQIFEQKQDGEYHVWDVTYPGRAFSLSDTLGYHGDNPAMFKVVKDTCRKIAVKSVKRGEINLEFVKFKSNVKFRCVPASAL